jgi:hypothetical protein
VNEAGGEQYFEINLQPGYQRVCGKEALEFVANRHEDTSLARDARDQRFLLETKAQYGPTLFENREKFERILGRAVETDLHGTGPVLDLLELLVASQGKPVRQVPFKANLLPTFDTASAQQIHESVQSFLTGTAPVSRHRLNQAVRAAHAHPHGNASGLILAPTPSSALAHARSAAPNLPFPLEYPKARSTYAGAAPDALRLYDIRDPQGHLHPTYAIVVNSAPLGQFCDIQGTGWTDAPLLSNPGQTVHIGSRTYELLYAGEQIRTIAWREANAAYWIQNTLTNSIAPREMLAMAEQTVPVINTPGVAPVSGTVVPRSLKLAPRAAPATSLTSRVGALLGLASLAALALLALGVLSRQRELGALREQIAQAMTLEARQRSRLATAGSPAWLPPEGGRTIYRIRRPWRMPALAAGAAGLLAVLVVLGVRQLSGGSPSSPALRGRVPVAVFNATRMPGEARRIAATLKDNHVHVGKVGDIKNAGLGRGAYVLFPPGTERQAQDVARLIRSLSPTVTPIQPQVQNAVGQHGEIVIVLD